jgi:hypothetical protein
VVVDKNGKRMASFRLSPEALRLAGAVAAALTERSGGALRYTKTDVIELAIRDVAKKEKVR